MLNQDTVLVIQNNLINTNAVIIMFALIIVVLVIQYVICVDLNRKIIAELVRYKNELIRERQLWKRQKRKEVESERSM